MFMVSGRSYSLYDRKEQKCKASTQKQQLGACRSMKDSRQNHTIQRSLLIVIWWQGLVQNEVRGFLESDVYLVY